MVNPEISSSDKPVTTTLISPLLVRVLLRDIARSPNYYEKVFPKQIEQQQPLIMAAVAEAHRISSGDISMQEQFVKGVQFALAALDRKEAVEELTAILDYNYEQESLIPTEQEPSNTNAA